MKIPRNKAAKGQKTKQRNKDKRSTAPAPPQPVQPPQPAPKEGVWQPGDVLEEDEELDFDASAYDCLVRFTDTWPSLSFDIVTTNPESTTSDFPHSLLFIHGTQAPNSRDNYLSAIRVKNIEKFKQNEDADQMETESISSSTESESEIESESHDDEQEKLFHYRVRHNGGVNRLRCMPQDSRYVAAWSERAFVQIYDMSTALLHVQADQSMTDSVALAPKFSHKHSTEGFALDWSRVKQGLLATGDCQSRLNVWQPDDGGSWQIVSCTCGHSSSVEDIQWSPTESTVFASASIDKTIKIWDIRETKGARLTVKASDTDVNVISWNKGVTYMLASGDDSGTLKIWDLRQFSSGQAIVAFTYHKKSITSVEWCPHETSMVATSADDNQIAIWDLALERDPEEEAQYTHQQNAQLPDDVPPQLLFLHSGQQRIKEVHWHPQIQNMLISTAEDGVNIFKPSNI